MLRLQNVVRDAEAAYAEKKPRFDAVRKTYPKAQQEEAGMLQGIGSTRDDLQLARAELLYLRGEGPRPRKSVDITDGMSLSIKATLAEQSRAEVGPLDYIEE